MSCLCRHSTDFKINLFSSYRDAQNLSKALHTFSFLYVKMHFRGKFSRARVLWNGFRVDSKRV